MSKKISELLAATQPLSGTELVEIVQSGVSKRTPAASLSTPLSASGLGIWLWSTGTSGDPTGGKVGANNATPASVTELRLAEVSSDSVNFQLRLATLRVDDQLLVQAGSGLGVGHRFRVSGSPVDSGDFWTLPVSYIGGSGAWPAADQRMAVQITASTGGGSGSQPQSIIVACSDETTALTAGTGKLTFRMPYAFTLTAVRASLNVAQTAGSIVTIDINQAGSSILSTKLTIDNTEKSSTTAAAAAVISTSALTDDAEITLDIDQIGDGSAKGLKVTLIGTPT